LASTPATHPPPPPPTAPNPPPQSRRPLEDLLDGFIERKGPEVGGFVHLCNTHLLQLNVSGGRVYKQRSGGGGGGASTAPAADDDDEGVAAAAAVATGGAGRCYVGAEGAARLQREWGELVAASGGGRETETTVSLRFFGGDKLYLPKALVVDEDKDQRSCCPPPAGAATPASTPPHTHHHAEPPAAAASPRRPPLAVMHQPDAPGRIAAAYFDFDYLCGSHALPRGPPGSEELPPPGASERALSAIDCLALAESGCGAVYLEGVPRLTVKRRDAAMRFVTLIDVLHDHGTQGGFGGGGGGGGGGSGWLRVACLADAIRACHSPALLSQSCPP